MPNLALAAYVPCAQLEALTHPATPKKHSSAVGNPHTRFELRSGVFTKLANQRFHRITVLKDANSGDSRRAILEADGRAVSRYSTQRENRDRNLQGQFAELRESKRWAISKFGRRCENRPQQDVICARCLRSQRFLQ